MTTRPAADFAALVKRVHEVLADGAGAGSTLPPDARFDVRMHPDQAPSVAARKARRQPLAHVLVSSMRGRGLSLGLPVIQRDVTVRLDLVYFAGREENVEARRLAQGRAADDAVRVSAALEHPGNLDATEAGEPTGLAGGLLVFERWDLQEPTADDRVLEAVATFNGIVEVRRP